jgi:uncharacterized protein DUF6332
MRKGPRDQAERDGITVEISYALLSAGFLAVTVFALFAGPVRVWHLPSRIGQPLVVAGAWTAGVLAAIRVAHLLRQHGRRLRPQPRSD